MQQQSLFEQMAAIVKPVSAQERLEIYCKAKFKHLSNKALVTRINGLPDFKWDDEGCELSRRVKASNGKFIAQMQGNNIVIIKDEK